MVDLKISIHPLFFIFGLYFAFIGKVFSFLICTLVALTHELGHYFASSKLGYKLNKITLMPYGAIIKGDAVNLKYVDECKIALAGPLINLLTALIFTALWWFIPDTYAYTDLVVFTSVTLAVINLIPCYPLDGGRFLLATLSLFITRKKAKRAVNIISFIFACLLFALFIYSLFTTPNITILFFSLFMFFGVFGVNNDNSYIKSYTSFIINSDKPKLVRKIAVSEDTVIKELFLIIDNNFYYEIEVLLKNSNYSITLNNNEVINMLIEENIYLKIKETNIFKNKKPLLL